MTAFPGVNLWFIRKFHSAVFLGQRLSGADNIKRRWADITVGETSVPVIKKSSVVKQDKHQRGGAQCQSPGSLRILCRIFAVPRAALFCKEISDVVLRSLCRSRICWSHLPSLQVTGPSGPITTGTTAAFTSTSSRAPLSALGASWACPVPFSWCCYHSVSRPWSTNCYVWLVEILGVSGTYCAGPVHPRWFLFFLLMFLPPA